MTKKYRVLMSFAYRGKDGKNKEPIIIGPGEEVPELDSNERERLLREERICEVSESGENIRYKKLLDLDDGQIDTLLTKPEAFIMSHLKSKTYSKDTLSKIYSKIEQRKLGKRLLDFLESLIAGEL